MNSTTLPEAGQPIAHKAVHESKHKQFFPWLFGPISGEFCVYRWVNTHCQGYIGAKWACYHTDNNTGFLAPVLDGSLSVTVANGFEGLMTAEAVGITAPLYALNGGIWEIYHRNQSHPGLMYLQQKYDSLRDFASQHAEAALICRAID